MLEFRAIEAHFDCPVIFQWIVVICLDYACNDALAKKEIPNPVSGGDFVVCIHPLTLSYPGFAIFF
jgi:hypothetical protein